MRDQLSFYTPIHEDLPAMYRFDDASWKQVQAYLGIIDDTWRDFLNHLIELPELMAPGVIDAVSPNLHDQASPQSLLPQREAYLDLVAKAMACELPVDNHWSAASVIADNKSNAVEQARLALRRKANFVRRSPFLWRQRSTPTGFLRLLCAWFEIDESDPASCPVLLEHARYQHPNIITGQGSQITILLPHLPQFYRYERVAQLDDWLNEQAPAYLVVRRIFVVPEFWPILTRDVLPKAQTIDEIFLAIRNFLPPGYALHLREDGAEEEPQRPDDLDVGRLAGPEHRESLE